VLVKLHDAKPGDIAPETFAPPPGRIGIDLCRADGGADCAQTLREWVKLAEMREAQDLRAGPPQRSSADDASYSLAAGAAPLVIATPEHNTHIWRNPEQPERLNRLALKLAPTDKDAQIVWTIDGEPFATAQADETVFWPMTPGRHRIQARLALAPVASRAVRIVIE
jgi:penicillin-binding protein 1C